MQLSTKSIHSTVLVLDGSGINAADNSTANLVDIFKAFAGFGNHTKPTKNSSSPRFDTTIDKSSSISCYRTAQGSAGKSRKARDASGGVQLDGFRFAKLCREAGLVDRSFSSTAADLIFTKVKAKGAKKISFEEFNHALEMIAAAKCITIEQLIEKLQGCGGPAVHAAVTTPDHVRFYDELHSSPVI
eukprot:gene4264-4515_t